MANENKIVKYPALSHFKEKLDVIIDGKVTKETGKGLSTNDYTTAEKNKLAGIAEGAQVNVIESITVDGKPVIVSSKGVDIDIAGKYATIESVNTAKSELNDSIDGKVDKVEGKGLSTNDLTDDLVIKINNAAGGNITLDYEKLTNKPTNATTEKDGFMSASDKTALDGMSTTIDTKIATAIGNVNHFNVVDTLPETGDKNVIYLIPKTDGDGTNVKDEYVYIGGKWEHIGDTAPDLTDYAKTTAVITALNGYYDKTTVDNKLQTITDSFDYATDADIDALFD